VTLVCEGPRDGVAETSLPGMVGSHPRMREVYRQVRRFAATELAIAIAGETGTGKELVARAVHALSPRHRGPFVDLNCAAIPEGLADGELFGWERGAFTGALRSTPGLVELAHGGTLFLDEACSLPLALQAKLLRAIEQRTFRRVGGRRLVSVDCRLVVAALARPEILLAEGRFRPDFAYRVAGTVVELPPLRARRSDVALLVQHFLNSVDRPGDERARIEGAALEALGRHDWPGNIRELRSAVHVLAASVDGGIIRAEDVASLLSTGVAAPKGPDAVRGALASCDGSVSAAARMLRVSRTTLYALMRRHSIGQPPVNRDPCPPAHLVCAAEQ